jgi:hypothetical protein
MSIFEQIRNDLKTGVLLRGDECFGWKVNASTENQMLNSLSIHDLFNLKQSYEYLKPSVRHQLAILGHDQLLRLSRECPHRDLRDRDHHFFLTQRLFGYLNPLSQLKKLVIPLRNPFMDSEILDFIGRVPARLRKCRELFKSASQQMFPEFDKIGIARYNNLVDWNQRLGFDPALRAYLRQALLEHRNGFDELVDRGRLEQFLNRTFCEAASSSRVNGNRRLTLLQRGRRRMARHLGLCDISPSTQLFRLMIMKIWADEYLYGNFDLN